MSPDTLLAIINKFIGALKDMLLKDNIYGKEEIEEPIILELIHSPSLKRLKSISQYGIPDRYYHFKNFNRYEHSLGVMLLLKRLGASLEEQVAGLLHDVSVLAFSHIADWVFGKGPQGDEGYHDTIHNRFVSKTEIPTILKKHGFSTERILDETNFPLLEREIPDLCADRVDYALREFKYWLKPKAVRKSLDTLVNLNGELVFSSQNSAFEFATNFLQLQKKHWGSHETALRYYHFSNAIKLALSEQLVSEEDFYGSEATMIRKLEAANNGEIKNTLKYLKDGEIKENKKKVGVKVVKKFRHVDPKVLVGSKLVRLSRLSSRFRTMLLKHRQANKKSFVL